MNINCKFLFIKMGHNVGSVLVVLNAAMLYDRKI